MEQINYEKLIPQTPPEDVVGYACWQRAFKRSYLIYKAGREYEPLEDRWRQAVSVVCSECGREFRAEKIDAGGCRHSGAPAPFGWFNPATTEAVIPGSQTVCPYCGKDAETVHVGHMTRYNGEIVDDAWVSVLSRLPVEGKTDRLVLTDWCVRRCVNKRGMTRFEVWPYTAWVVEERKVVRLSGYTRTMSGCISLFGEWRQRRAFYDDYGSIGLLMPWDTGLLEGTTAENSKLDLYLAAGGMNPVAYLVLWRKRPAEENLLVQGAGQVVAELIERESGGYSHHCGGIPKLGSVNWKEKRPARMLGLNMEEFRQLRQMKWNASDLVLYKTVRGSGVSVRLPEDMELLRVVGPHYIEEILREADRAEFWRILRYLKKQGRDWYTLRDYWNMARRLDRDLTDSLVRWPRNLKAAHDRVVEEQEHRKNELLAEGFRRRAEELAPLAYERDGLLIRPCRDQGELIAEGKALHHCVNSYAKEHSKGRTAILFIRRAEEPDVPYFTLELDERTLAVRQNRGLRNCDPTKDVKEFVSVWLEWARNGCKCDKDGRPKLPRQKGAAA